MAALHLDSKHTSLVLSWLCSFIIATSLVHYSPLNLPLRPPATLYTSWHPTGKRVRPTTLLSFLGWPFSQSQQGKADIKLYGYLHSIVMYNIPQTHPYGTQILHIPRRLRHNDDSWTMPCNLHGMLKYLSKAFISTKLGAEFSFRISHALTTGRFGQSWQHN